MRSPPLPLPLPLSVLSCLLAGACAREPATEAVVRLKADPQSAARAASLRVRVCNGDRELRLDRTVPLTKPTTAFSWPATVPLAPEGGTPTRAFALLAELADASGDVFHRQRVLGGYVAEERVEIDRRFSESCQDQLTCGVHETCVDGACTSAVAVPAAADVLPCAPELACAPGACPPEGPHAVGVRWNRAADWSGGRAPGTRAGNPDDDVTGRPVWRYEIASGGTELAGARPWFAAPTRLLSWDGLWFTDPGVWAAADNTMPAIAQFWAAHPQTPGGGDAPLIRWQNPTGRSVVVAIVGQISVQLRGGATGPVEIVLARASGREGRHDVLLERRVDVATIIPIQIGDVAFDARDSLVLGARGAGAVGWVGFEDSLTLTLARFAD